MKAALQQWKRISLGAVGIAFAVATFAYFLPKIADYRDVWAVLQDVSPAWLVALFLATLLNIMTFAPPWMVALPGIRFRDALALTQVSTALSIVVPGGAAVGIAGSFGILRRWGFAARDIGRAVTLVSLWNQFANLSYPIIAVFLLTTVGGNSALLATAAFIGVGILGVVVAAFGLVLYSDRMASDIGDVVAQGTNWAKRKLRRAPVTWNGASFERFRDDVVVLLRRRWHLLTLVTYVGTLSVFLVMLFSLRACGVPATQISLVEAFAAWSLARLLGSIPITPGGIGVVELGLTGALLGFGGANAGVVAAVLLYRFLTMVPTVIVGLAATTMLRRHPAPDESSASHDVPGTEAGRHSATHDL